VHLTIDEHQVVLSAPHQRQTSGGSSDAIILKLLSSLAVSTRLQYCGALPLLAVSTRLQYCGALPLNSIGGPPDEENKLNMTALEETLIRRITTV
jgi:hypothetical protein